MNKHVEEEKKKLKPLYDQQVIWKNQATAYMENNKQSSIEIPKLGSWKFTESNSRVEFTVKNLTAGLALFFIQKGWVPDDNSIAATTALEALNFADLNRAKKKNRTLRYIKPGKKLPSAPTDPVAQLLNLKRKRNYKRHKGESKEEDDEKDNNLDEGED